MKKNFKFLVLNFQSIFKIKFLSLKHSLEIRNFKLEIPHLGGGGFTIVEVLVVSLILGVIGYMMSDIVTRSLQGSQKTTVIGSAKQNGQVVMDTINQVVRSSDQVVCLDNTWSATGGDGNIIVLYTQDGRYVRISYVPGINPGGPLATNGFITKDFPVPTVLLNDNPYAISLTSPRRLCDTSAATGVPLTGALTLTDLEPENGVDVRLASGATQVFQVTKNPGTSDTITIQFGVSQGVRIPAGFANQLAAPTEFRETIQLR